MSYTTLISEDPPSVYSNCSVDSDPETKARLSQEIQYKVDQLQDIIKLCEDKIIKWKSFRNSVFSSVSRFPDELLVEIFLHLRSMETRRDSGMISWIEVTHVCSRWRNTALGFPELWNRPYLGNHECAVEMIKRARSAPLDLVIYNGQQTVFRSVTPVWGSYPYDNGESVLPTRSYEAAKVAFSNIHRARQLYLWEASPLTAWDTWGSAEFGASGYQRHPWELDGLDVSSLLKLTLRTSGEPYSYFSPADFPFDKFLGSAPKLRQLRLENWTLNRSAFGLLDQLTELEIAIDVTPYCQISGEHRTPTGIISDLRGLINLQALRLYNITVVDSPGPWDQQLPGEDFPALERAELSRLQTLEIQDSCRSCLQILEGICYPSNTSVNIKTRFINFYPEFGSVSSRSPLLNQEMNEAAASLQLLASRLEAAAVRLSITFTELRNSWRSLVAPVESDHLSRCSFSYGILNPASGNSQVTSLSVDTPLRVGIRLLPHICNFIPLHALRELHCSLPYSDVEFWTNIGTLPSIEMLTVKYTSPALVFILSASEGSSISPTPISHLSDGSDRSDFPAMFFPALRRLIVDGWQFAKTDESDLWAYPRAKASLPDLIRSLSIRYEQTNICVMLTLDDCPSIIESDITKIILEDNLNSNSLKYIVIN